MASQNDIMRYYREKIQSIEAQIRNIDAHLRELDDFEARVMRENLPNEYKQSLHSTLAKAKNDASIVKQKAIATAGNLKSRIHAFMQNPKGDKR